MTWRRLSGRLRRPVAPSAVLPPSRANRAEQAAPAATGGEMAGGELIPVRLRLCAFRAIR